MPRPVDAAVGVGSTIADIATFLGGDLEGQASLIINGLNGLEAAGPDELTFLHSTSWAQSWPTARAGAALVTRGIEASGHDHATRAVVIVEDSELAMIQVLEAFAEAIHVPYEPGVDPTAVIHESAHVGQGVHVGPHSSIGPGAHVGDGACLLAGVRIGPGAIVGARSILHANVVVERNCRVGQECRLHACVVVGADGFGYRPDPNGPGLRKVPHLGTVVIGDDVEIGAGSCIDRGKFGATSIGDNTKIDNLVQVAHNVTIGCSTVIAAQVGIAGSAVIGNGVQVGAHAGIVEHVTVGDGARIGAKAGVIKDVPAGEAVAGIPAQPAKETLRQVAALRKLPGYLAQQGRRKG